MATVKDKTIPLPLQGDERPKVAGVAKIKYGTTAFDRAERRGSTITLPNDSTVYKLERGRKFVAVVAQPSWMNGERGWFGGTDEKPFLAELNRDAIDALLSYSEEFFFQFLRPESIDEVADKTGAKPRRQGDIFAIKLPLSWKAIATRDFGKRRWLENILDNDYMYGEGNRSHNVFNTRHRLQGPASLLEDGFGEPRMIGEGILKAPDHKPVKLVGPHLIQQANGLGGQSGVVD